jgi:hypothetical protein
MAHFAEIGIDNTVLRVLVIANKDTCDENGIEREEIGATFCKNLLGGVWKQTSYNRTFRKNFAGQGYTFDAVRNAFISPQPFASWVLNEDTCGWSAPTSKPNDGKDYTWDEATTSWVEVTP